MAKGLELPSTGWWSSLVLPWGESQQALAQCMQALQASCFLPYPLCSREVQSEGLSNLPSYQRLAARDSWEGGQGL